MASAEQPVAEQPSVPETPAEPKNIVLVSYPKFVFLYPVLAASFFAGLAMWFIGIERQHSAVVVGTLFMAVLCVNLVVLAFDFPRTTSLTLFFLAMAVVFGLLLLFKFKPDWFPTIVGFLGQFRPRANATFYWSITLVMSVIYCGIFIASRFDYWEVRPNELLHHHGFLANLERWATPNLKIDKEVNDIFEYVLLRSGRLILHSSAEKRAIILENVPFIKQKEEAIMRMLGALQVDVRSDATAGFRR